MSTPTSSSAFGELLKEHRLASGLTQETLAEWAGVSVRSIQALERGESHPQRETMQRLATALKLPAEVRGRFTAAALPAPRQRAAKQVANEAVPAAAAAVGDLAPTNLPAQLSSFVGRTRELAEIRDLFSRTRLITLTGPGGVGKTRLGLQAAASMVAHFADGVCFVGLASLADPAFVPSAIAQELGVQEGAGRPVLETLKAHLRDKQLLLMLDNFEHLLDAAPAVSALLAAASRLQVLVTSREVLRLSGEHEVCIVPLALPEQAQLPPVEWLREYDAVRLFIARARAVRADFELTARNARAVAAICQRLDGLPLAIELAAARLRLLSPQALLDRLERRLPLLTGGGRDLPARQQTLANTIAWSYDLLELAEQVMFRRIGCPRQAAGRRRRGPHHPPPGLSDLDHPRTLPCAAARATAPETHAAS